MTAAEKSFYQQLPPRTSTEDGGRQVVVNVATGAAAVKTAIFSMPKPPEGDCMVTFQADTNDAYIRTRSDAGAAGTTASNGIVIKAGASVRYWLSPLKDVYVDHIAPGGVGVLKWYVSSPVYDHYKQSGT